MSSGPLWGTVPGASAEKGCKPLLLDLRSKGKGWCVHRPSYRLQVLESSHSGWLRHRAVCISTANTHPSRGGGWGVGLYNSLQAPKPGI